MTFKKQKILSSTKKTNKTKLFGYIFGFGGIVLVFFAGVSSLAYVSDINLNGLKKIQNFYKIEIISSTIKTIKEEKINNDKINILVAGRGGGNHDAPNLTDTLILLSLNSKKGTVSMLSIPRDTYISYGENKRGKINRLFESSLIKHNSVVKAMGDLEEKIEEITGEKIDYFVNLDFKGFIDLVNSVGGIKVNVPETFIDYKYPDGNLGYTTFILRKGEWTIDGDVALKYARSRHSTSDFDRSLRQQIIINSLKEKMVSLNYLTSPTKIRALYETFQKDIQTDIPLKTLIFLAIKIKDIKKENIFSSNLNDSCYYGSEACQKGGFLYTPIKDLFGGMSVLLPNGASNISLSEYSEILKYSDILFNKTEVLKDRHTIKILNATKTKGLAGTLASEIIKYGFNISILSGLGNIENKTGEKSVIIYNGIKEDDVTLLELQKLTGINIKMATKPLYSGENTRIEIILADDYKKINGGI